MLGAEETEGERHVLRVFSSSKTQIILSSCYSESFLFFDQWKNLQLSCLFAEWHSAWDWMTDFQESASVV
jgi:hypothetical protein